MPTRYAFTWFVYALVLVASGCVRYFAKPDGEKGLYFGLAMGGLALAAGAAIRAGRARIGHAIGFTSIAFVLGWNVYEALVKNGGSREPRLLIVAGLSVVQLAIAVAHLRRRA